MNVAFFHDHWFPRDAAGTYYSYGGLSHRVFLRYLKHFDRIVVVGRVRDVSEQEKSARWTVASGDGVEMACVDRLSLPGLLFETAEARHVREVLSRVDCAIVRLPSSLGMIAAREAIRLGKPWMAEVVGCAWDALWNHGSPKGKVAAGPLFLLNRRWIRRAPRAIYVSERFLQRRYPCPGETIGCSDVVVAAPDPAVLERRLARIRSSTGARQLKVGMVGHLDINYKGHETAIRAMKLLRGSAPALRLACLGGGEPGRWRRLAERAGVADAVEFVGMLPSGGPVMEWMDGLDVFIIPSLQEGLPRALVEAMSRGLPAVGSRTGGIPELVDEAYLHAPKDARGLADRIRRLVTHPEEMLAQSRRSAEVTRRYGSDVLEARWDRFLERFKAVAAEGSGAAGPPAVSAAP